MENCIVSSEVNSESVVKQQACLAVNRQKGHRTSTKSTLEMCNRLHDVQ